MANKYLGDTHIVSNAKMKRLRDGLKFASSEVARVRSCALITCATDKHGNSKYEGRGAHICDYVRARNEQQRWRIMIASAVIVKGATASYAPGPDYKHADATNGQRNV